MGINSALALVLTAVVSLAVAGITSLAGLAASRTSVSGQLQSIRDQIERQQAVEERERLTRSEQRYLTPLRYYALTLSRRFAEIGDKLPGAEGERMRAWFQQVKDHVTRDRLLEHFDAWCFYEGVFAMSTVYYTCSYLYFAHEVQVQRPFAATRPRYTEHLEARLAAVGAAFARDPDRGLWDVSQETLGERFAVNGSKVDYAELCREFDAGEPLHRAAFYRLLDFYWVLLDLPRVRSVQAALDELVAYLDAEDPRTDTALR